MSDIRANTISNAAGTGPIDLHKQSAAKAWTSINGTGTASILNSFNVSSLTDIGTGSYLSTMTNAMSAGDEYATTVTSVNNGDSRTSSNTASAFYTVRVNTGFAAADTAGIHGVVHGDLA